MRNVCIIGLALSKCTRIKILELLFETGRMRTGELIDKIGISRQALIPHLNLLIKAGLVKKEKVGEYELTEKGRKVIEFTKELKSFKEE